MLLLILDILATIFAFFWLPRVTNNWKNPNKERNLSDKLPSDPATRRGIMRAIPVGFVGFLFLVIGGWGIFLLGTANGIPLIPAGPLRIGLFIATIAAFALVWIALLLTNTVIFFNKPKMIIPPTLRDQPGTAAEWLKWLRQEYQKRQHRT